MMEAELSMRRRMDDDEENILGIQTNLASTYGNLGRNEQAHGCRETYTLDV